MGSPRQQALLTALLLEADHVVPLERLVDVIWNEAPPASAKSQVRICVSGLRRLFADHGITGRIETHPAGYLLKVAPGELDLAAFEEYSILGRAAAEAGSTVEAVTLYRSALGVWLGPIGAGLDSKILESVSAKFQETRLTVLEDCFDLELKLGRERQIVGELAAQVTEHPFRERLAAQFMLALFRSGRKVEALEFFRKLRARLDDELGIRPAAALRDLEYAILTSDSGRVEIPSNGRNTADDLRFTINFPRLLPEQATDALRTEDRLAKLEQENAELKAEHLVFKRVMSFWMTTWEGETS
ncbi:MULTISPECIES: AfsR/SARP family transcriptional regulator [unclassified Streptomyces]|uniref:AfsR/SARP family transcriptional regulator n=1 Tax=unclassified Streptomyces TaxID=2593676 RepID=UPI002E2A1DE6|nr:AfsR/SARP family transcriptional regulator [Streptomyces sp. NBC_00223]